jgi:hypothetical protein
MKIYFLIEIALLLAACLTAIIVTVKNAKLRKTISNHVRSISDLKDVIHSITESEVELTRKLKVLKSECEVLMKDKAYLLHDNKDFFENHVVQLTADLPARREKESDAQYLKRCRQAVANKAAKYVKVSLIGGLISLKVIK